MAQYGPRGAASLLSLAATPTFAVMALITVIPEDGGLMAMHATSPWTSMATMYGLMSLFHAPAWLRLLGDLRRVDRRT